MKPTIAVIGAGGRLGSAISSGLAAKGYTLLLTDDVQTRLGEFVFWLPLLLAGIRIHVSEADVRLVLSEKEASWEADIIVCAVSPRSLAAVVPKIREVATGKIVVCLIPASPGTHDELLEPRAKGAFERLSRQLPHSRIVMVVSTDSEGTVQVPEVERGVRDVIVAGDEEEALATVMQLVKDMGFHPVMRMRPYRLNPACFGQ